MFRRRKNEDATRHDPQVSGQQSRIVNHESRITNQARIVNHECSKTENRLWITKRCSRVEIRIPIVNREFTLSKSESRRWLHFRISHFVPCLILYFRVPCLCSMSCIHDSYSWFTIVIHESWFDQKDVRSLSVTDRGSVCGPRSRSVSFSNLSTGIHDCDWDSKAE